MKEIPLLDRIYKDPLYQDLCRFVGYSGTTYRDLRGKLDLLGQAYGKGKAEAAQVRLLTYEGQAMCDAKPLAEVRLRAEVRRYCHMLLGPPPEAWDQFYRNADGTPGPRHAEKMAELERLTGKPVQPCAEPIKPQRTAPSAKAKPGKRVQPSGKPKKPRELASSKKAQPRKRVQPKGKTEGSRK